MKTELTFADNRMYLAVDANITAEQQNALAADGWKFLNNAINLEDGTPAIYFWKAISK